MNRVVAMPAAFNECVGYPAPGKPLPFAPDAIYVGGAGNLVVTDRFENVATFIVTAGATVQVDASAINPTTTATGIVLMRRSDNI